MYWFVLGREFKLSIAEILTVFNKTKTVYFDRNILILDNLEENELLTKINNLWWVIKVTKIINQDNDIKNIIIENWVNHDWKFKYWLNLYWNNKWLKIKLLNIKKDLKANKVSSRFVNKDFKNLSSAQILGEKLIERKSDYNSIILDNIVYNWITIWTQNIDSYSKRDYSKDRDMNVGMLPPKLSQMMINISEWKVIYDPFVWLWTILIESLLMWNKEIYWSDLSQRMVDTSYTNIDKVIKEYKLKDIKLNIFNQNSKYISEIDLFDNTNIDSIVSEWYLWEVMTQKNISQDRINIQKWNLLDLYNWFFTWLKELNYKWNIVISFPFWKIKWKYIFFDEIYELLEDLCEIQELLPEWFKHLKTKKWSLLYKRDKQLVWREIFKLKMK